MPGRSSLEIDDITMVHDEQAGQLPVESSLHRGERSSHRSTNLTARTTFSLFKAYIDRCGGTESAVL